ncbi:MAG: nuclear transport factor 2 family protein [Woeseiaceae bacterium]|nr:nuclear transport factor 2 family protein [Woeseiaceae bacterium]
MTAADTAGSDTGGLFAAIDNKDAASFVQYLAEDAVFRFGSAPPVRGRAAIREAVDGFFATIAGCRHAIGNSLRSGRTLVCEGEVTYRRHDDSEITLPFTNVFEYQGKLIAHYKIYIDIGPLYA